MEGTVGKYRSVIISFVFSFKELHSLCKQVYLFFTVLRDHLSKRRLFRETKNSFTAVLSFRKESYIDVQMRFWLQSKFNQRIDIPEKLTLSSYSPRRVNRLIALLNPVSDAHHTLWIPPAKSVISKQISKRLVSSQLEPLKSTLLSH